MASIFCPHCDAVHEIDHPVQSLTGKKVRCASCRQIFAVQSEDLSPPSTKGVESLEAHAPLSEADEPLSAEFSSVDSWAADSWAENAPAEKPILAESAPKKAANTDYELSYNWDEPAESAEKPQDDALPFSAMGVPLDTKKQAGSEEAVEEDSGAISSGEKPASRRKLGALAQKTKFKRNFFGIFKHDKNAEQPKPAKRTMLMAAGFASLAAIGVARHDIVRVMPQIAPVFESLGLPVNLYGLEFHEIKSRISAEAEGETLEITGGIQNITNQVRRIPVMRLAIQNAGSQDVFVWTASADIQELAPGEVHRFRRRLASPPADAHHVVVRFLAKDDVIAAIQ